MSDGAGALFVFVANRETPDEEWAKSAAWDKDVLWWRERLPGGWKLMGYTSRFSALAYPPDSERPAFCNGELLEALHQERAIAIADACIEARGDEREQVSMERD